MPRPSQMGQPGSLESTQAGKAEIPASNPLSSLQAQFCLALWCCAALCCAELRCATLRLGLPKFTFGSAPPQPLLHPAFRTLHLVFRRRRRRPPYIHSLYDPLAPTSDARSNPHKLRISTAWDAPSVLVLLRSITPGPFSSRARATTAPLDPHTV